MGGLKLCGEKGLVGVVGAEEERYGDRLSDERWPSYLPGQARNLPHKSGNNPCLGNNGGAARLERVRKSLGRFVERVKGAGVTRENRVGRAEKVSGVGGWAKAEHSARISTLTPLKLSNKYRARWLLAF